MDYQKQYNLLISKYQALDLKKKNYPHGSLEKHHIIPRSFGGSNEKINLVMLPSQVHFIAHKLLVKIYGDKMIHALWFMSHPNTLSGKNIVITSRTYKTLKEDIGKVVSKQMLGTKWALGNKQTDKWIATAIKRVRSAGLQSNNVSGYKGVSWCKRDSRWRVYIQTKGKNKALGSFINKNDAIIVRLMAELKYWDQIKVYV